MKTNKITYHMNGWRIRCFKRSDRVFTGNFHLKVVKGSPVCFICGDDPYWHGTCPPDGDRLGHLYSWRISRERFRRDSLSWEWLDVVPPPCPKEQKET